MRLETDLQPDIDSLLRDSTSPQFSIDLDCALLSINIRI